MKKESLMNMVGKKYGKLYIKQFMNRNHNSKAYFMCICECGNEKIINGAHIKNGSIIACGCIQIKTKKTHGKSRVNNPLYEVWRGMKQRCLNKNSTGYKYYRGVGITICKEWINSFEQFSKDIGRRPKGYTLDRINPYGNYEPSNCRWASWKTQMSNRRVKNEV